MLGAAHAADADLFGQHQPTLDDEALFDDGQHEGIALFSWGRDGIDHLADRDALDVDAGMLDLMFDVLLPDRGRHGHSDQSVVLPFRD